LDRINIMSIRISGKKYKFNEKHFELRYKKFHNLPIEIVDLINLELLYLDNNYLQYLPSEIGNLRNLKYLSYLTINYLVCLLKLEI